MKGRFAPSPTGYIHLGNVWIALLSYISTRNQNGTYVVRMEDIDLQRSKRSLGEALLDDLEWLGFEWDEGPRVGGPEESYWQSERFLLYDKVLNRLEEQGLIYPCFCNRARLQSIASAPHRGEVVHHYDGHCRDLDGFTVAQKKLEKSPSMRIKVADSHMEFVDLYQGSQHLALRCGSDDFVLRRGDGMYAYNLAVVLDDISMGITEIIRGHDLLETTAQQLFLYRTLQANPPFYGHAPLLIDTDGHRLSKRQKSITVKELRELGWSPERILGELAVLAGFIPKSDAPSISLESLLIYTAHTKALHCEHIVLEKSI